MRTHGKNYLQYNKDNNNPFKIVKLTDKQIGKQDKTVFSFEELATILEKVLNEKEDKVNEN